MRQKSVNPANVFEKQPMMTDVLLVETLRQNQAV